MSISKVGLIYEGPPELFSEVFYTLYKYADISVPPEDDSKHMKIKYDNGLFYIDYNNRVESTTLSNFEKTIKLLIQDFPRSIFLISENSFILTDDGISNSIFEFWDKKVGVDLLVDDIVFRYEFYPPLGEIIFRIPSKWIELEIVGDSQLATLNNKKIEIPSKINVPPSKIVLENNIEKLEIDLTNFEERKYTVDLQRLNLFKQVHTNIEKVFELESGTFFYGNPFSIWISETDEPIIVKSRFYCNYGNLEEKSKSFYIDGEVIFAYEKNRSVYLITSSGHFLTLGDKNLNRDFGRSPLAIMVGNDYILLETFKLERYKIDFNGGIFKEGNVYNMKLELPNYAPKKNYEIGSFKIVIEEGITNIYYGN
ncbi:hypothetical protein X924_03765 [Petrotoga sp. 9PWA.NaAc.5.4]|nr:hypothetical protein X924_03765 [Petrotoga sp. 9PWA.NaAc.5.4]